MNQYEKSERSSKGVVGSFADVIADVTGLAELQFQLVKLDASESAQRLTRTIVLGAAVSAILLGTVPIILLLFTSFLHEQFEMSVTLSLLISAGISLAVVVIGGVITFRGLKLVPEKFSRSATELQRNVQWLKNLKSTGRKYPAGPKRSSQLDYGAEDLPIANGNAGDSFRNVN